MLTFSSRSFIFALWGALVIGGCGDSSELEPGLQPGGQEPSPGDCDAPKNPEEISVASLYGASDGFIHGRVTSMEVSFDSPQAWDKVARERVSVETSECERIRPVFIAQIEVLKEEGVGSVDAPLTVYFELDTFMYSGISASKDDMGVEPNERGEFLWTRGTTPFGIGVGDEIAAFLHQDEASGRLAVVSSEERVFQVKDDILTLVEAPAFTYYCDYPGDYINTAAFKSLSGLSVADAFARLKSEESDAEAASSYRAVPLGRSSLGRYAPYCWRIGSSYSEE